MDTLDDILLRYYVVVSWLFLAGERKPETLDWVAAVLVLMLCAILGVLIVTPAALRAGLFR